MGNPAQNEAGYRGTDGEESELLRAIRRDASRAKREGRQDAGQTSKPQEPSDERISQLEKQVLLLTQENVGLKTRVNHLETATKIYEQRMNNYLQLNARLGKLEQERERLMNYYASEFNRIITEGQSRIQSAINQVNQATHTQHPNWNVPTHIPWQPGICSSGLPRYHYICDIMPNLGVSVLSTPSYISRIKENANNIYSRLSSSVSEAVGYLKEKIGSTYDRIKHFALQKKRAIAVAAAVGAVSLAAILGSYGMRQTDITPWTVAQPAPITYLMPAEDQTAQDNQANGVNPLPEQFAVHTVAKGDTLWDITENYLRSHDMDTSNQSIYSTTDRIAELNGKEKQADYPIGVCTQNRVWNEKSPHCIRPGEEIKVPR